MLREWSSGQFESHLSCTREGNRQTPVSGRICKHCAACESVGAKKAVTSLLSVDSNTPIRAYVGGTRIPFTFVCTASL